MFLFASPQKKALPQARLSSRKDTYGEPWSIVEEMGDLFICDGALIVGMARTVGQADVIACDRLRDGFEVTDLNMCYRIDQVSCPDVLDSLVAWLTPPQPMNSVHAMQSSSGACLLEVMKNGEMFLDAKRIEGPGLNALPGSGVAGQQVSLVKMISSGAIVKVADIGVGKPIMQVIGLDGARAISTDTSSNPVHLAFATATSTVARLDDRMSGGVAHKIVYQDRDAKNPTTPPVPCKDYIAVGFDNGYVRKYTSTFKTRAASVCKEGARDGPVVAIASSDAFAVFAVAHSNVIRILPAKGAGDNGSVALPRHTAGPIVGVTFVNSYVVAWTRDAVLMWDRPYQGSVPLERAVRNVCAVMSEPDEIVADERGVLHTMCAFTVGGEKVFMDVV
jgi:hypothetical protein